MGPVRNRLGIIGSVTAGVENIETKVGVVDAFRVGTSAWPTALAAGPKIANGPVRLPRMPILTVLSVTPGSARQLESVPSAVTAIRPKPIAARCRPHMKRRAPMGRSPSLENRKDFLIIENARFRYLPCQGAGGARNLRPKPDLPL